MRFSKLIAKSVRMVDAEDAEQYVGGPQILQLMVEHQWVKPAVQRHRLTRYDVKSLDQACDRLSAGEFPGGNAVTPKDGGES